MLFKKLSLVTLALFILSMFASFIAPMIAIVAADGYLVPAAIIFFALIIVSFFLFLNYCIFNELHKIKLQNEALRNELDECRKLLNLPVNKNEDGGSL